MATMAAGLTQMVQRRECAIKRARGRNEKTPALRTVAGKKKGSKGGGGGQGQGQRSASDTRKTVREGQAYQQETRKNALQMHGLTKRLPDGRVLFDNLNLALFYGAKVSIVGQNGVGKSSLLKCLAGIDQEYEGSITYSPGLRIGYLPQDLQGFLDKETAGEVVEEGLSETRALLEEFNDISMRMADSNEDTDALMERFGELQQLIDNCNGWDLEKQKEQALDALRCPDADAKVANLSGGERRRVALARLFLQRPDVLMLDEVSNSLDALSVQWIEDFLKQTTSSVILVTHDRLLMQCTGWTLELSSNGATPFECSYEEYLEQKEKQLEKQSSQQDSLKRQLQAEREFLARRAKGSQSKGKARQRRVQELEEQANQQIRDDRIDNLTIPIPKQRLGDECISLRDVCKSYDGRALLSHFSAEIPSGATVALTGSNGSGKSTLCRLITGVEQPDKGEVHLGQTVQIAYSDQARSALEEKGGKTVVEALSDLANLDGAIEVGAGRSVPVRQYASFFHFRSSQQQRKVSELSGGERNRLHLALNLASGANTLILDEPENDLSTDALRALESALEMFPGTILMPTHDRALVDRLCTHVIAFEPEVEEAQVRFVEGNWSDYFEDFKERVGDTTPSRVKRKKLPT